VEAHARAEGYKIVGVYAANERPGDFAVGAAVQKLGKKAAELCPGAVVLLLDAASFQTQLQGQAGGGDAALPFVACLSEGARWRVAPQVDVRQLVPGSFQLVKEILEERRERRVVDFEDHLEDLSRDWLNPGLVPA